MSKATRRRPLPPEKLGEKGETRFKEVCTDAGLIANKAVIDEMGWDYLVQFPYPEPDMATPLDKRLPPMACKVQVKTVWDNTTHIDLKLSAAERLAKADRPSFIVVLSVDERLNFVAMHVFHMLDKHLERVLKRLRKATSEGSLKINHAKISFYLRDGESVSLDGNSLLRFINESCGDSRSAYCINKQDQFDNLGFGRLRFEGKFTIKAESELEIAKIFLGLRPVDIINFQADEIRFGIKLPSHAIDGGILSITPNPIANCKIIAKGRNGSLLVNIPGKLFLTKHRNANGSIPFRISTALFEIFVNGTEFTIDNKSSQLMTTPASTKQLLETLKFHSLIAGGGGTFRVLAKNKQVVSGQIDTEFDQEVVELTCNRIQLVECMATVLRAAESQPILVSLSSLIDGADDLMFLNNMIENKMNVAIDPIKFRPEDDIKLPPISEALLIRRVRFSDFTIAYYAVLDVVLVKRPPDVVIEVRSASLRDVAVLESEEISFEDYKEEARLTTGLELSLVSELSPKLSSSNGH